MLESLSSQHSDINRGEESFRSGLRVSETQPDIQIERLLAEADHVDINPEDNQIFDSLRKISARLEKVNNKDVFSDSEREEYQQTKNYVASHSEEIFQKSLENNDLPSITELIRVSGELGLESVFRYVDSNITIDALMTSPHDRSVNQLYLVKTIKNVLGEGITKTLIMGAKLGDFIDTTGTTNDDYREAIKDKYNRVFNYLQEPVDDSVLDLIIRANNTDIDTTLPRTLLKELLSRNYKFKTNENIRDHLLDETQRLLGSICSIETSDIIDEDGNQVYKNIAKLEFEQALLIETMEMMGNTHETPEEDQETTGEVLSKIYSSKTKYYDEVMKYLENNLDVDYVKDSIFASILSCYVGSVPHLDYLDSGLLYRIVRDGKIPLREQGNGNLRLALNKIFEEKTIREATESLIDLVNYGASRKSSSEAGEVSWFNNKEVKFLLDSYLDVFGKDGADSIIGAMKEHELSKTFKIHMAKFLLDKTASDEERFDRSHRDLISFYRNFLNNEEYKDVYYEKIRMIYDRPDESVSEKSDRLDRYHYLEIIHALISHEIEDKDGERALLLKSIFSELYPLNSQENENKIKAMLNHGELSRSGDRNLQKSLCKLLLFLPGPFREISEEARSFSGYNIESITENFLNPLIDKIAIESKNGKDTIKKSEIKDLEDILIAVNSLDTLVSYFNNLPRGMNLEKEDSAIDHKILKEFLKEMDSFETISEAKDYLYRFIANNIHNIYADKINNELVLNELRTRLTNETIKPLLLYGFFSPKVDPFGSNSDSAFQEFSKSLNKYLLGDYKEYKYFNTEEAAENQRHAFNVGARERWGIWVDNIKFDSDFFDLPVEGIETNYSFDIRTKYLDPLRTRLKDYGFGDDAVFSELRKSHGQYIGRIGKILKNLQNIEESNEVKQAWQETKEHVAKNKKLIELSSCIQDIVVSTEGLVNNREITSSMFSDKIESIKDAFSNYKKLGGEADDELDNLVKGLENYLEDLSKRIFENKVMFRERVYSEERDDYLDILESASMPVNTCLSYAGGSNMHCLPSYLSDGNKKVINVVGEDGEIKSRTMIRCTSYEDPQNIGWGRPAIVLENTYSRSEINHQRDMIATFILSVNKSTSCGCDLVVSLDMGNFLFSIPEVRDYISQYFNISKLKTKVLVTTSRGPCDYSDTLSEQTEEAFANNHRLTNLPKKIPGEYHILRLKKIDHAGQTSLI